jgi:hypothetical protein
MVAPPNRKTPHTEPVDLHFRREIARRPAANTPDFPRVYAFFASLFDPGASCSTELLSALDVEVIKLLSANLETNISDPTFRCHLFDSYRNRLSSALDKSQ